MNIVVRMPNWIGDAVMALPALEAVERNHPDAPVGIAAVSPVSQIFSGTDRASRVTVLGNGASWRGLRTAAADLRSRRFDAGLLLTHSFSSALIFALAGIPERWGSARDGRGPLLTRRARPRSREAHVHHVVRYLDLVESLGFRTVSPDIRLAATPGEKERGRALLSDAGLDPRRPLVLFHPGASYGPAKRWPPERFAELGRILQERRGAEVALTGTAEDTPLAGAIRDRLPRRAADLTGRTTLRGFLGVAALASAFVTNDTGPMHLANALRVPVVALFGPTDPAATAPFHEPRVVLKKDAVCWPCLYRTCPYDHRCLVSIPAEEAAAGVEGFL